MPRSLSVCDHVVAKNEVLVAEDLARDRRLASNPLLRERGLRLYADVPLRAANGQPIGTLCLFDTKPHRRNGDRNTLKRTDLDDLESPAAPSPALRVACHNPKNRHERKETGRVKSFTYEELIKRDKVRSPIERAQLPWTHSKSRCLPP